MKMKLNDYWPLAFALAIPLLVRFSFSVNAWVNQVDADPRVLGLAVALLSAPMLFFLVVGVTLASGLFRARDQGWRINLNWVVVLGAMPLFGSAMSLVSYLLLFLCGATFIVEYEDFRKTLYLFSTLVGVLAAVTLFVQMLESRGKLLGLPTLYLKKEKP